MTIQELRDKRRTLNVQADAILKKAHDDKREILTGDEEQEWQRLHDEMDALKRHIDKLELQAKRTEEIEEPQARAAAPNPVANPGDERRGERNSQAGMRYLRQGQADMARALRAWLLYPAPGVILSAEDRSACERVGVSLASKSLNINFSSLPMRTLRVDDQRDWEYRAQAVGTGSAGGFTVPDELMRALERALLTFGGMRERCTVIRTETGADLPWPTANDTSQKGAIIAENASTPEQDVTFAQLVLNSFLYSSKMIRVSVQLLQDAAINVPAVLGEMLGERIGRITNEHFTLGSGAGQPNGIVPASAVGFTAPNADNQVTTWKYASIIELVHSVDPAYRRSAAFMMADSSIKKTKLLVDTQGRPLWASGIAVGAPDTLDGYPIVVNQDVAAMAANAKSVVFGDLSKYIIRDVLGVQLLRLDERYAEFHQVAFLAFTRNDGDLLNAGTNPVKVFVNAAS